MGDTWLATADDRVRRSTQHQMEHQAHESNHSVGAREYPSQAEQKVTATHASDHNPIMIAATPLLTLMTQIRHCANVPDVPRLHQQIVTEVTQFIQNLRTLHIAPRVIDCCAYCICAALDEAVLATEWGTQSLWVQQSLLSMFRSETLGGERFYVIAETLAKDPRKNKDSLELVYALLSLGFEGRYYGQNRMVRDEIRNRLFQMVRLSRGKVEKQLSPVWREAHKEHQGAKRRIRLKRLSFTTLALIVFVLVTYNIMAYHTSVPTITSMQKIGRESPITAYSQLIDRSLFPDRFK
jgi:type VI secretion system protein ImpK